MTVSDIFLQEMNTFFEMAPQMNGRFYWNFADKQNKDLKVLLKKRSKKASLSKITLIVTYILLMLSKLVTWTGVT